MWEAEASEVLERLLFLHFLSSVPPCLFSLQRWRFSLNAIFLMGQGWRGKKSLQVSLEYLLILSNKQIFFKEKKKIVGTKDCFCCLTDRKQVSHLIRDLCWDTSRCSAGKQEAVSLAARNVQSKTEKQLFSLRFFWCRNWLAASEWEVWKSLSTFAYKNAAVCCTEGPAEWLGASASGNWAQPGPGLASFELEKKENVFQMEAHCSISYGCSSRVLGII